MKKILLSSILLFTLFVMMQSCQKDVVQSEKIKEITIDTTITAGSDYLLKLASYGDEGDVATILDKGSNFAVSQVENETDMFTSIYHYRSNAKANGIEQITLSISQNPKGRQSCSKDSTIIYINLTLK